MIRRPNTARGCVKTPDPKFCNDTIFDMADFDESGRWIEWSKNEFSHRLALEPTAFTPVRLRFGRRFTDGFRGRGSAFGR